MTRTLTKEQMSACLKAQQGEVDAVAMYERLAKKVKDDADKKAFARLAGDEARHAAVFQQYTNRVLKPKPTKRIAVPAMYRILGKKRLYPIIAGKEYDAADMEMLDLGYATTIHKSQGSEYRSVIINLQCAHTVMLTRPLVYTAITRGKDQVILVGERKALCIAIKKTDTEKAKKAA